MPVTLIRPFVDRGAAFDSFDETGQQVAVFEFDATLSESRSRSVAWTEHPVEDGTVVTDHGTLSQETASFSGKIARSSLAKNPGIPNEPGRLEAATDALFAILAAKQEVTVFSPFKILEGYRVASVSVARSPDSGQAADYTVELVKIATVSSELVAAAPATVKADKRAAATPEQAGGTQTGTETTPDGEAGPDGLKSWGAESVDFFMGE